MELNLICYDKLSFSQFFADERLIKGGYVCQEGHKELLLANQTYRVFFYLEANYGDQSLKGLSKSSI